VPAEAVFAGPERAAAQVGRREAEYLEWSPEQIAGHLAEHFAIDTEMRVSHEAIYNLLFMQARGVLAKQLQKHLRSRRPIRRNVHNTVTGQWRSQITDPVSIRHRPAAWRRPTWARGCRAGSRPP